MDKKGKRYAAVTAIEMMARVVNLNERAPKGIFYVYEFNGGTEGVTFAKYRWVGTDLETIIHEYAYLDGEEFGRPLAIIEQLIEAEELKQLEVQE